MNLRYIVYITINTINNNFYIGVHLTDINKYDSYIGCGIYRQSDARKNYRFHRAVRKYKYENFKRFIICSFDNTDKGKQQAYETEARVVNSDLINNPCCYNTALGGKGSITNSLKKTVYKFSLNGKLLDIYESVTSAASSIKSNNLYSVKKSIINNCLGKTNSSFGFYWSYKNNFNYHENKTIKSIAQYDLNGKFIKKFKSIQEAQKSLNCNTINQALNKKCCAGGYQWRYYTNDCNILPITNLQNKNSILSINMYDKDGNFIENFKCINDCIQKYPFLNSSQINRVLSNKIKSHKEFKFKYSQDKDIV